MNWSVRIGAHATTVSADRCAVYTFDLEGRPISWWEGDRTYRRSLASEVHETRRENGRAFRVLSETETAERFERILEGARNARNAVDAAGQRERLDRVLRWSAESLLAEGDRFRAVYSPIPILPPDQYTAVVLQATFGCTWNRCTFCNFYQDRPFRLRPEGEFRDHARKVERLLGQGAALRRWVFLADGNALALSADRLDPIVRVARDAFPDRPLAGFLDVFTGARRPVSDWRRLHDLGLRRVHVGLESGHDPLLAWMDKPGRTVDAVALVRDLKAADLEVGLIFLVGAGGRRFADGHVLDTIRFGRSLPLDRRDLVYLSPFVQHPDSPYSSRADRDGLPTLAVEGIERQYALLRDGIRATHPHVRVARYDLRAFLY